MIMNNLDPAVAQVHSHMSCVIIQKWLGGSARGPLLLDSLKIIFSGVSTASLKFALILMLVCSQFPQELVTYGGNGQVFSNWAQVDLIRFMYL